ncbi:MAG: phosphatidate cytidylyltransferase [Candidatus Binatia bacterium]
MLPARLATAAIAIPILLWLIFRAPFAAYSGVVLLFTLLALIEYFSMAFSEDTALQALGIVSGALVAFGMGNNPGESASIFSAGLITVVTIGLIVSLFAPGEPRQAISNLGQMVLGVVYAGAFLPHFIWLRVQPADEGPAWVTFVLAVAMGGDSGGYFAGRLVGKRLLMPSVSPKKTVEGSLGAIAASLVAAAGVKILLLPTITWKEILVLAFVVSLLAQLGDLCESLLKRAYGAKDSGWLLPGHGGILDRADSLVFPIALVYYYVNFLRTTG